MVDHHIMGGGNAALEESYFLFYLSWLKVDHHMMGGGCCVSSNDLGAESALADFGTESVFLTWKPSQISVLQYHIHFIG